MELNVTHAIGICFEDLEFMKFFNFSHSYNCICFLMRLNKTKRLITLINDKCFYVLLFVKCLHFLGERAILKRQKFSVTDT